MQNPPKNNKNMASPLIGAGISALGSIAGNLINRNQAKKQWKREIAQNEKFWNMQNEYNSPQAQMNRLQEAGLNPHLVYGGSSGGTAGTAEMIKTPDMDPSGNRVVTPEGNAAMLGAFTDFNIKQAQTDNLKSQTQVNQETALLKATQTYGEGVKNARSRLDLNMAEDLYKTSVEAAKEQLRKLKADTQFTVNEDTRKQIMLGRNVKESIERVLTSQNIRLLNDARAAKIYQDHEIGKLEVKLSRMGIRNTDPFYVKATAQLIKHLKEKYGL